MGLSRQGAALGATRAGAPHGRDHAAPLRPAPGMNKMVINHLEKLFVTNDASTIVSELEVEHPAAKLVVMAAAAQQQEIGDGTNFVSLCGRWCYLSARAVGATRPPALRQPSCQSSARHGSSVQQRCAAPGTAEANESRLLCPRRCSPLRASCWATPSR